ncbi:ABC transporter ATP-binding protein [Trujillonella endophytica]|uniref:NitT/TauT family transport system ATP-binding protein n=1 Tax=Trujillonella endophytica TaxID=673521 RepID=A0A1H8SIV6_9ACTN|nr:ABC transporter ATP-binding protein [Trujillella endophytica]SEO78690.1 NitT/TauT family transport system ATP-binding protein [Trujillella endophytica]
MSTNQLTTDRLTAEDPLVRSRGEGVADAGSPAAAVRVSGVSQVFERGRPPVLDGVDLTVAPGEFVCLVGASGCGKSTLLNLLAGLVKPTAGQVEVSAQRPALMFQEPALLPWLTASGNVELALRARGVGRVERRAEAARLLGVVNLADAGRKRVHELSGGMRQRVALARALAQDSSVLLMDEPFAALDAITRDVLHLELARVWAEQQLSVVFVTHNVREAVRLGQRVVLMGSRPGRIVREWRVDLPQPRTIESAGVSELAAEITRELHREISRHGN